MPIANCKDNDDLNPDAIDCVEVACTNDIRALYVNLKDKSGVLISLDLFTVTKKKMEKTLPQTILLKNLKVIGGMAVIFSDFSPENQRNTNIRVIFKGFIDAKKAVQEEFFVGSDCCHVPFVEGNNDLVID